MDRKHWKLGDSSALFESRGTPDTISEGSGDHGGVSYGTYQLSSKAGTVKDYVTRSKYAHEFKGLTPATEAFDSAWKKVARENADFGDDQMAFIKATHVDPVVNSLVRKGIDFSGHGEAVQDMVWGMAVQYRGHAASHIKRGLTEAYGADVDVTKLGDADVVRAVQRSKLVHVHEDFASSAPMQRQGVETRIRAEERALVRLAETGSLGTVAQTNADWNEASPIHPGSPRDKVTFLQESLSDLGMISSIGDRLVADGHFGPSTEDAVKAFQSSVGLPRTGAAGALTMHHLNEQVSARYAFAADNQQATTSSSICRLDDAAHPDHDYFRNVRACVMDIDRRLGRSSDQYTDNLASALTVQARADGLRDVGKVTLSTCGEVMWAYQTPPDWGYDLFARDTSIKTKESCTSMEESAAKWPQAMQQFQTLDEARQRSEQDISDRHQARIHGRSEPDYGMAR